MFRKRSTGQSVRNPRLAGPRSRQPVFSYRAVRRETDRQLERGAKPAKDLTRLKRKLKHLPYAISFIAICAALLYNLTLVPNARVIVSGDQVTLRPLQSYQEAINNRLESSLSSRTKVTINTKRLSADIQREFPEIETLNISLPLLRHQPIIEVKLAAPAALLATSEATYILDGNGRALFDENDARADFDTSKLPVITDSSGHEITLGAVALTSAQIIYANELLAQSAAKQLQPESMTLQAGGEELHVRFQKVTYTVKFSFGADSRQSFGTFLATRERLERERATVAEYIDVRIPERAYVK